MVEQAIYFTSSSWIQQGSLPEGIQYSQEEFQELWEAHPAELGKIKLFGKIIDTPRYQQTYLRNYQFTGLDHQSDRALPPLVQRLLDWTNREPEWQDASNPNQFNQVLINWYQDGSHYIGPHSDSEKELIPNSPIFSLSLGATRTFRLRKKVPKKTAGPIERDFILGDNTYVVMGGTLQKTHKHEITKITGQSAKNIGPRINITFRKFI